MKGDACFGLLGLTNFQFRFHFAIQLLISCLMEKFVQIIYETFWLEKPKKDQIFYTKLLSTNRNLTRNFLSSKNDSLTIRTGLGEPWVYRNVHHNSMFLTGMIIFYVIWQDQTSVIEALKFLHVIPRWSVPGNDPSLRRRNWAWTSQVFWY